MRTLRFRIAAILVLSIVCVVGVATVLFILVLSQLDPQRMIGPMAGQITAIDAYYREQAEGPANNSAEDNLKVGALRPDLTQALHDQLLGRGVDLPVSVYDTPDGASQVASVTLSGRQIRVDFPQPGAPPPDFWIFLGRWMGLVTVGVAAVALVTAYRVTRPFIMMETAIASVGPDGVLPTIPEAGSGEVRQMAAAINRLSARLKHAMESRMRLVAAAGHDLRTPMTRMRIRAEFLTEEERGDWLADLDELELIADSAIRLVREEAGAEDARPLALDILLEETVTDLADQHFKIELSRNTPAMIRAGHWALKRALRNLLINAATHGGGGRVSLLVDASTARLVIEDFGPGIPEELIDKVFEPFFRAEPGRIQTVPGAGLGLAIAREIVDRFGGAISIVNRPGGGLVQTLIFPLVG